MCNPYLGYIHCTVPLLQSSLGINAEQAVILILANKQLSQLVELRGHESMVRCMVAVQMEHGQLRESASALSASAPVSSLRKNTQVWSADVQGNIIIWDALHMAVAREVTVMRGEAIFSLCQVGSSMWIGTSRHIYSLDLKTFALSNWRGHQRPINDIVYHKGFVWTASNDGTIKALLCFLLCCRRLPITSVWCEGVEGRRNQKSAVN